MTDLTVRKTVEVAAGAERAFAVFTEEVAAWWPVATHSHAGGAPAFVDGRLVEAGGHEWGVVTAWEPPRRIALTWTVNPGRPTELEIRFTPVEGGTRVDLVHSGWERHADGAEASASYSRGWDGVLAPYAEAIRRRSATALAGANASQSLLK